MPNESPAVRKARLAELKRQIAAGTYETPERLAAAVEGLLAEQGWDEAADEGVAETDPPRADPAGPSDGRQQESCQSPPGPNLPR